MKSRLSNIAISSPSEIHSKKQEQEDSKAKINKIKEEKPFLESHLIQDTNQQVLQQVIPKLEETSKQQFLELEERLMKVEPNNNEKSNVQVYGKRKTPEVTRSSSIAVKHFDDFPIDKEMSLEQLLMSPIETVITETIECSTVNDGNVCHEAKCEQSNLSSPATVQLEEHSITSSPAALDCEKSMIPVINLCDDSSPSPVHECKEKEEISCSVSHYMSRDDCSSIEQEEEHVVEEVVTDQTTCPQQCHTSQEVDIPTQKLQSAQEDQSSLPENLHNTNTISQLSKPTSRSRTRPQPLPSRSPSHRHQHHRWSTDSNTSSSSSSPSSASSSL